MKTLIVTLATALAFGVPTMAASGAPEAPNVAGMTPTQKAAFFSEQMARDPSGAILVPAGSMLEGRTTEAGFQLAALPIPQKDSTPMSYSMGGTADCNNNVLNGWYYPVSSNPKWPLGVNTASAGQCKEEIHTGPITLFQFRTSGDYYGFVDVYGDNGSMNIGCTPSGSVLGAGYGDEWRTTFDGQDMWCYLHKSGAEPSEFNAWYAYVTNYHFWSGSTFASFS